MIRTLGLGVAALMAALLVFYWRPPLPQLPIDPGSAWSDEAVKTPTEATADRASDRSAEDPEPAIPETPASEPSAPTKIARGPASPVVGNVGSDGFIEETLTARSDWAFDEGEATDLAGPVVTVSRAEIPADPVDGVSVAASPPLDPELSAMLIRRLLSLYETVSGD